MFVSIVLKRESVKYLQLGYLRKHKTLSCVILKEFFGFNILQAFSKKTQNGKTTFKSTHCILVIIT